MAILPLAEAQQLHDALGDPLCRPALEEFIRTNAAERMERLTQMVCSQNRDTHKESQMAGQIEAYENLMSSLELFAKKNLEGQ